MRIKVDDTVKVLAGDDRGETGKVLSVDHAKQCIVVEGVNKVLKHVRRSQQNPQGGRLSKEMPLRVCKVQLVCSSCGKPTRIGYRALDDGGKERFCKKCDASLGQIAPGKTGRT